MGVAKLSYIDSLRGWAVLGVVVVHVGQYVNLDFLPVGIRNFISSGSWGVQLFFFASAFSHIL